MNGGIIIFAIGMIFFSALMIWQVCRSVQKEYIEESATLHCTITSLKEELETLREATSGRTSPTKVNRRELQFVKSEISRVLDEIGTKTIRKKTKKKARASKASTSN